MNKEIPMLRKEEGLDIRREQWYDAGRIIFLGFVCLCSGLAYDDSSLVHSSYLISLIGGFRAGRVLRNGGIE